MIDWITPDVYVVDLKKTVTVATQFAFQRNKRNYDYDRQAWFYSRGFEAVVGRKPKEFIWIVSESEPPNECRGFVADWDDLANQEGEGMMLIERYAECLENVDWPGYPDDLIYFGYRFDPEEDLDDIGF